MNKTFISLLQNGTKLHGWKTILDQLKTPYIVTNEFQQTPIIICSALNNEILDNVKKGSVVIVEKPDLNLIGKKKYGQAFIEKVYFPKYKITDVKCPMMIDVYEETNLIGHALQNENRIIKGNLYNGKLPITMNIDYGLGKIYALTGNLSELLFVHGNNLRTFSEHSIVSERVSNIDKSKISAVMENLIQEAHDNLNIPLFKLSYYPNNEKSIYMVRVDVDGIFGNNLANLVNTCDKHQARGTFFVNKNMCIDEVDKLSCINSNHEIGNHGVVHNVFDTYAENAKNIIDCEQWVKEHGSHYQKVFVAPRGMYNDQLGQALLDNGYTFSSDFGYSFDGFPQFALLNDEQSNLLQIPCNPLCVGRSVIFAQDHGLEFKSSDIVDFYQKMIEDKIAKKEPIMIYGHPQEFGKHYQILDETLRTLKEKNIKCVTMSEFNQWWRRRNKTNVEIKYNEKELTYEVTINDDAFIVETTMECTYKVNYITK